MIFGPKGTVGFSTKTSVVTRFPPVLPPLTRCYRGESSEIDHGKAPTNQPHFGLFLTSLTLIKIKEDNCVSNCGVSLEFHSKGTQCATTRRYRRELSDDDRLLKQRDNQLEKWPLGLKTRRQTNKIVIKMNILFDCCVDCVLPVKIGQWC